MIFGPVIYQTAGINFYGAGMLSIQLDIVRGISADSCGLDILFPAEDPKFGSDAEHNWIKLSNTIEIEVDFDICSSKRIHINQTLLLWLHWSNPSLVCVTQFLSYHLTWQVDTYFTLGYIHKHSCYVWHGNCCTPSNFVGLLLCGDCSVVEYCQGVSLCPV